MFWVFTLSILVCALGSCSCGDDDDDDASPDDDVSDDDASDDDTDDDPANGGDDDSGDDDSADDDIDDDADDDTADVLPTQDPVEPGEDVLPAAVESCAIIGETQCVGGLVHECAIYDSGAGDFADDPPALLEQVFYLDRYHDLYLRSDNSGLTFRTTSSMAPGTPESVWADPANFETWRDWGDGAFYMGMYLSAAALRYASTGTGADYARMVDLLNKQLVNWRATGVPGYMFRSIAAMLEDGVPIPHGHPEYNLREYKTRSNHVLYELSGAALAHLPAYYAGGVTIDDTFYPTTPLAEGSPSLDAFSGAIAGLERAWALLGPADQALKDEIAENVACSLTRLRKMRITNLSQNALVKLALEYLTSSGGLHPDPDDIDLTTIDTMIGYVQEAIPPGAPGDFEFGCPADLPFEVDPKYDWDAADPITLVRLLDFANAMSGQGDRPIDFTYFVSHRGGDVAYLLNYAIFAYHATGEDQYRRFIREGLIEEIDGYAILQTLGSFFMPPFCGDWIGGDLIHPIVSLALQMLGDDPLADELRRAAKEELKDKLLANDGNAYFGITYGAALAELDDPGAFDAGLADYVDWAADELRAYRISEAYPLDPKRTYTHDYIANPLPDPDFAPVSPTQADIDACEAGLELFGYTIIPGPGIHPDFQQISANPLPVGLRVAHDLIWHFSPFNLARDYGSAHGRNHFIHADLTLPFWLARVEGL
ncbi:hypothetical protein K8I61_12975, partial [bacterium]|nr:hypothetical protein [bacterium]